MTGNTISENKSWGIRAFEPSNYISENSIYCNEDGGISINGLESALNEVKNSTPFVEYKDINNNDFSTIFMKNLDPSLEGSLVEIYEINDTCANCNQGMTFVSSGRISNNEFVYNASMTYPNSKKFVSLITNNEDQSSDFSLCSEEWGGDPLIPVEDTLLPEVFYCDQAVSIPAPKASNNSGTIEAITNNQFESKQEGSYEISWLFDDGMGNTFIQRQKVIIEQTTITTGEASTLCHGGISLSGLSSDKSDIIWTSNGSGTLTHSVQKNNEEIYYIPSLSEFENSSDITLEASVTNSCGTVKEALDISVLKKLTVHAGVDQYSNDLSEVTLIGTSSNSSTFTWKSSGTGTFTDNNQLTTIYTPSQQDQDAGMVKLTLSGDTPNCEQAQDEMLLTLAPCEISIEKSVEDNNVSFKAINSNKRMLTAYTWSFGDNNTGKGKEVHHTYGAASEFSVALTATTADGFCNTTTSTSISITDTKLETYSIEGTATSNNSSLDEAIVSLFHLAPTGNIEILKEVDVSANGEYSLTGLKPNNYFVTVHAKNTSEHFTNSLPTFLGDVTKWEDVSPIELTEDFTAQDIDLHTFTPVESDWNEGDDQVKGTVTFDEDFINKAGGDRDIVDNPLPVQNAIVTLFDTEGNLLAFTTTDEFGEFAFNDLEVGVYDLRIEYLGTAIAISQTIIIDGDGQTVDHFAFKVGQDDVEDLSEVNPLSIVSNKNDYLPSKIYPNPTTHTINITLADTPLNDVGYTLISLDGKTVVHQNSTYSQKEISIDVSNLQTGVYIIRIDSNEDTYPYRFTKY